MFNTKINGNRIEKLCTLLEWLQTDRLKIGQKIYLATIVEDIASNHETLYVGNCTPYHQPNEDSGDEGWDWQHPRMSKFVLEVYEQ
jgi:hypothetical protein